MTLCGLACAAALSPSAFAADAGAYLGLEGGVNFLDDEIVREDGTNIGRMRYKNGYMGGLTVGAWTDIGLRPEIELGYRRNKLALFHPATGGSIATTGFADGYSVMGNLWWEANMPSGPFHWFHPYLGGGAGGLRFGLHQLSFDHVPYHHDFDTVFAWQAGTGIAFNLTRDVLLGIDYRYLQSNIAEFKISPAPFAAPEEMRYRANTLMLSMQARFGVAPDVVVVREEVPVAAPPPPPPPVAPDPCSLDDDGDGVGNCEDKCPGTARGFKVDATGCVVQQTVVLHNINFEFNKDTLTGPARDTLNEIAGTLRGQRELYVEIGGHTDSIGSPQYNRNLSQRRADSVMRYLVGQGVEASHLTARGYGEDVPIAGNDTEDGRAENRRVEFKVLQQPPEVKVVPAASTEASKAAAKTEPPRIKRQHGQ